MHLEAELIRSGQADGTFRGVTPEALARLFSGLMGAFQALDPLVMSDDPHPEERFAGRAPRPRRSDVHGEPDMADAPFPPEGDWLGRSSSASSATASSPMSSSTGPRRATPSRRPCSGSATPSTM